MEYWDFNITSKQGIYFTLHSLGVYRLIVNETFEGTIVFFTGKMMYCPYKDSTRDILSNIPHSLQEFPLALPSGTPSGEGVYFTVYSSSRPNTDTVYIPVHRASCICPTGLIQVKGRARLGFPRTDKVASISQGKILRKIQTSRPSCPLNSFPRIYTLFQVGLSTF